jgi:hypothetical protein
MRVGGCRAAYPLSYREEVRALSAALPEIVALKEWDENEACLLYHNPRVAKGEPWYFGR